MALDRKYFTGELALPQLVSSAAPAMDAASMATQVVGENSLDWFIAKYESEFLVQLLGDGLYEAYMSGISEDEPLQVWIDLDNKIYKFVPRRGAFTGDYSAAYDIGKGNGFYFSAAANYVYFFAMRHAATQTAMAGEIRHTPDFATVQSPSRKMVKAWNDMIDEVTRIREWIFVHRKELLSAAVMTSFHWRMWCQHDFRPINEFGI